VFDLRSIDDTGAVLGASIRPALARVRRQRIPPYEPGHMARAAMPASARMLRGGWTRRGVGVGSPAMDAARIADADEEMEAA